MQKTKSWHGVEHTHWQGRNDRRCPGATWYQGQAIGLQRQGITISLIQLYLRTGVTLQPPLNADIMSQLLHFLEQLHAPFVVGGNWQNEPDASFKAQILSA